MLTPETSEHITYLYDSRRIPPATQVNRQATLQSPVAHQVTL